MTSEKRILLLGGNGYVGARLYDHLLDLKYNVVNVDLCWFGKIFEETVVKNYDSLPKDFINQFSHVILLAAHSSVAMCGNSLVSCFQNNVMNYVKLIDKLDATQTLIYASSGAVYGNNDNLVDENHPLEGGISYYDYTKICNDKIACLYPEKKIVGLRFGSVGGFSKNFRSENLLNAITISSVKTGKMFVTCPENYRSVLGMKDMCNAFIALIESPILKNRVYNVTSVNSKIIEFAEVVKTLSNADLEVKDTISTSFSFNCDNSLFSKDYDFTFQDTVKTIFEDIVNNQEKIVSNVKRGEVVL